jgi:hypothetical protein
MKLLSSTPLPPCQSPEAGSQPVYTHSLTDESYIAVALTDTTVHVLSSRTGAILQKRPFEQPGSVAIGLVIDGDTLILAYAKDPSLTIYDIPSE